MRPNKKSCLVGDSQNSIPNIPKSDTVCTRDYITAYCLPSNSLFLSKIGLSSLSSPCLHFGTQGVVLSSFPFNGNYFTLHLWLSFDLITDNIFRLLLVSQLMTSFPFIQLRPVKSNVWLSHHFWIEYCRHGNMGTVLVTVTSGVNFTYNFLLLAGAVIILAVMTKIHKDYLKQLLCNMSILYYFWGMCVNKKFFRLHFKLIYDVHLKKIKECWKPDQINTRTWLLSFSLWYQRIQILPRFSLLM
jgi:hypothetical protein